MTTGEKILALLRSIGKSPRWLSLQIAMPYTNLNESIKGIRLWRSGELERVAEALGVNVDELRNQGES